MLFFGVLANALLERRTAVDRTLDELAHEMFRTFARFEYALKVCGFHKGDGRAEPNWRVFAETVSNNFANSKNDNFREAVSYILKNPPKKQIIKDGLLDWKDSIPQTDLESDLVLQYVRRVRNNLHHGGKFNGRWFEPDRSHKLLDCSLAILRMCLDLSPSMRQAYDSK